MDLIRFHQHRQAELREFFQWRFQTRFWVKPLSFCTGLNLTLCRRFRSYPMLQDDDRKLNRKAVSSRELLDVEACALHLGFKPSLPRWTRQYLQRLPPHQLPAKAAPEVKQRFYNWRRETNAERVRLAKRQSERKAREARGSDNKARPNVTSDVTPPAERMTKRMTNESALETAALPPNDLAQTIGADAQDYESCVSASGPAPAGPEPRPEPQAPHGDH